MNEIRDPIYGYIEPTDKELAIINTPLVQRLRRIKQLAMANLVYPGANHTRFDHSLGVFHVASLMANKLLPKNRYDTAKQEIIRYAALLHDVGHGPFSHVSEAILKKFVKSDNEAKVHEQITIKLIENDPDIKRILGSDNVQKVTGLLRGNDFDHSIMKEIISGPIDADKIDYLLRDSYFCGVKYGVFDLARLINTMDSYEENGDPHIAIKYEGLNSLEQFILAKYYMTRQVYRHKVRLLTDAMIVRALELGIEEDGLPFLKELFTSEQTPGYLENFLLYSDEKIFNDILFSERRGHASDIFERLQRRKLFKRIFSESFNRIPDPVIRENLFCINKNEKKRKELEEKIAQLDILKQCNKKFIIVNSFKFKSVKEMSKDNNEGKLIIKFKDETQREFQDESLVFRSINETLEEIHLEVYAPIDFANEKDRADKMKKLDTGIKEILKGLEIQEV